MEPIHDPCSEETLSGNSEQGGVGFRTLGDRLTRYAVGHSRALLMSDYLKSLRKVKLSNDLCRCGSYLVFKHYYTIDQLKFVGTDFCKKSLLDPLCAMRRGAKYFKVYSEKVVELQRHDPELQCYLVTLMVKNGPDLMERFNRLTGSFKKMVQSRRDYLFNSLRNRHVEFAKVTGGVYSIEIKRGQGSDLWHPHIHILWLGYEKPDQQKLSNEWFNWTKDSYIVDVTPFYDQQNLIKGFLEVFKYALKFTELSLEDNWLAFQKLSGKRLINSFGCLRGLEVFEGSEKERLDYLPYLQIFYEWLEAAKGYSVVVEKTSLVRC